jgi:5'-nucleotidase
MQRRVFIKHATMTIGAVMLSRHKALATVEESSSRKLTLLHTNDVHSRIEPFPMDGGKNAGLGGVAARADLIQKIRATEDQVLLLDAGDIFQGTPYFNFYKGEPEIMAMTAMQYDAATIGNHDFDAGLENLRTQMGKASFDMINCNYDFTGTAMEGKTIPYKIFKKGRIKIGVLGVGIEMKGLVPDELAGATKYLNPIEKANEVAGKLKKNEQCDLIVCLSHLGYKYDDQKVSDQILAKETEYIDVIIGGHTHTFLPAPEKIKNKFGADVIINQVGFAGIKLGRLDFEFSKKNGKNFLKNHNSLTVKKSE